MVEVTEITVRRGLLWRRVLDSVTIVFEVKGVAVSTLGSTMSNPEKGGYAQLLTSKLLAQDIKLEYTISVVVSQDSEVSLQLAVRSAGASAVGSAMETCMASATTGICECMHVQAMAALCLLQPDWCLLAATEDERKDCVGASKTALESILGGDVSDMTLHAYLHKAATLSVSTKVRSI